MGKTIWIGFAALLLATFAGAALLPYADTNLPQAPMPAQAIEEALRPILMGNETYSLSPGPISAGRWAYLIYIGGSAQGVLLAEPHSGKPLSFRLLTDVDEMRLVLVEYYRQAEAADAATIKLDEAHFAMKRFNDSRTVAETECRRLLGMMSAPCHDYDTCLRSCYASTSFCQPIALSEGKPFIYEIVDYQNRTERLDVAMEEEYASWRTAREEITLSQVADYRRTLQSVSTAKDHLSAHRFHGLICQKLLYDNSSLTQAYKDIARSNELLMPLSGKNNTALLLADATKARMERKKNLPREGNGTMLPAPEGPSPTPNQTLPKMKLEPISLDSSQWLWLGIGGILAIGFCMTVMIALAAMVFLRKRKGL